MIHRTKNKEVYITKLTLQKNLSVLFCTNKTQKLKIIKLMKNKTNKIRPYSANKAAQITNVKINKFKK